MRGSKNKNLCALFLSISLIFSCKNVEEVKPIEINIAPTVITEDATNVTLKSAVIVGKVLDVPYAPVTEKGFSFANSTDGLNLSANTIKLDTNVSAFKSQINKLIPNKTYYYKAYAKNKYGTAYGIIKNFTTGDYLLPTLTTDSTSNITLTTVKLYGNVTDDGETPIFKRGFCISTNPTPTTTDSTFNTGNGMGVFNLVVIKLKAGTKYNVRAFATNAIGTAYGKEITFSTLEYKLPTIQTNPATDIGLDVVTLSGNVKDLGRGELKERGIVVSKSPKPTIENLKFKSSVTDLGEYKIVVTKLEVNTKYYVRAYTQNDAGIVYGDEINFTTDNYTAPKVSTNDLQNISFTSLRAGLEVQSEGNTKVTDKGVVISTNPIPDLTDLKIQMSDGIGGEMRDITGLTSNVTYYLRGYATNKWGTSYGDIRKFTTKDNTPPPTPIYVAPTPPTAPSPPTPIPGVPAPAPIVSTPIPTLPALPEYVSVPDSKFEQALIVRGYDNVLDGRIKTSPIANITELIIMDRLGITNVEGIEAFRNLTKFQLEHNNLTSVNLSKNINLTWISLWDNKLTTLDVKALSKLQLLGTSRNPISYIDISHNLDLREIDFQNNRDASAPNYGITEGYLSLDISKNTKMERIYLTDNRLTTLDVSNNPNLTDIWAEGNKLQSLDCTKNPLLNMIIVPDNLLSYLNIKGTAKGSMGVPSNVVTKGNASLFEIKVDNVGRINEKLKMCGACYERDAHTKYVE